MRPLSRLAGGEAEAIVGVVFDLDDTLLTDGQLSLPAYAALHQLRAAGLRLVACTGRPAGWGDVIGRQWPLDLTVTENGAIAFARRAHPAAEDGAAPGQLVRIDRQSAPARAELRARLLAAAQRLREQIPEARLADDNTARSSDVTFDVAEHQRLAPERVRALVMLARRAGMRTFQSSIHVHVTFDCDDKATGTLRALRERFGEEPVAARRRYAFIGDSGSDGPCFAAFRLCFGVSNVRAHLGALSVVPRYVSAHPAGEGFAAIASRICALRAGGPGGC